ncbi:MAG: toluene monooxygenase [Alphaproteobacteria bacterium]|nr:toluene monooxygenase [Alphaproteobacteria bacterium]
MALFPLVSSFEGEVLIYLLAVDTENTMDEVAAAAAEQSAGKWVPAKEGPLRVRVQGKDTPLDRDVKVKDSGLAPMTPVQIYYED